ncbi:flavodoxin family protein, partial [Francisella tularensis]|uniref:flavodoxin family protein n=1 Tax=Francisella tularensis TaxID=263 RepID=UPI0023ACFEE7|nr:tryptophan repressor-binding protein [Francisella tularensis subsp. holarctica]
LHYSHRGSTKNMAHTLPQGVEASGATATFRTVPNISAKTEQPAPLIPDNGDLYATNEELAICDGLIVGSPAYFGTMASP